MNKFIVFEGIDGSGKSTQIKLLQNKFSKKKIDCSVYREPGGNPLSEKIRDILLDKSIDISDSTETLLFIASRAQLVNDNIYPDLNNDKVVICDRFSDSTYVYEGYGKHIDKNFIEYCNKFATKNIVPLLTIIMNIDYKTSRLRINGAKDRMEENSKIFFKNVINGYKYLALSYPEKYLLIDGTMKKNEIHDIIWNKIIDKCNL